VYRAARQLRHRIDIYLNTWGRLRSVDMSSRRPLFKVGDTVRERFPTIGADVETGIVLDNYDLNGQYRYVVRYESGRETAFFENELILDGNRS
jgi:hypothetical protein